MTRATRQTIQIKPIGGVAGDMFVGACAALWPDRVEACLADLEMAGLPETVTARFDPVTVNGFASMKFRVGAEGVAPPETGAYPAIAARLRGSPLDPNVRDVALAILTRLGEAEAQVHGKTLAEVHFHELADWDSFADIVAAASFIARAPDTDWSVGPLPLGGCMVTTQHGRVTAPAPATLALLRGYEFHDDGVGGERVTPTGAAIVAHLTRPGRAARVHGPLTGAGFGAGDRRFDGLANVLQLVGFAAAPAAPPAEDLVAELSFDIDDMTPEEIAVAADRLRAAPCVLDVAQTPMIGKKGRALIMLRLLCDRAAAEDVVERCFLETSTLGVRIADIRRRILPRTIRQGRRGAVKVAARPDGGATAKAESDDLADAATLSDRRARREALEREALADMGDPGDR